MCIQNPLPTGIDIELLDVDEDPDHFLVSWPIGQINIRRRQQVREVGRQCSLEGLVQALGPLRVLDVSDFIRAIARQKLKVRRHV